MPVPTLLPLYRFAQVMGLHPLHFMQVDVSAFHNENNCVEPIFQYSWQHADAVSRDEIALAIYEAEIDIADYLGYWPAPKWDSDLVVDIDQPYIKTLWHAHGWDVRGDAFSIKVPRGHFISGGRMQKTLIDDAVGIVYSDPNGDGYNELATITVATSVTDPEEIAIYYQGLSGDDEWEIRPITVSIAAGVATITCRREQLVLKSLLESFTPTALEGTTNANFETTVDVYRKYHDPSVQVQFFTRDNGCYYCDSEGCEQCGFTIQTGCMTGKDKELGIVTVKPGDWNSTDSVFDSTLFDACRRPDYARVWFRSGYRDTSQQFTYTRMAREWELAIAKLAISKIDRNICSCKTIQDIQARWNTDYRRNVSTRDKSQSLRLTQYEAENAPFGTTVAGFDVWRLARRRTLGIS